MAKDEAGSLNIVQGTILRSTDFVRRIIAPAGGQGGVTLSYLCPQCNGFPLEDHFWVYRPERSTAVGGAQSLEKNMNGKHPTGYWWSKQVSVPVRQRFSKRMRYRKVCVNICSMRSSCWRTKRKMEIAQSRVL